MVGHSMVFLLSQDHSLPSAAWSQSRAGGSPIPNSIKHKEKKKHFFPQYSNLSGGCLKDWSLGYLTQIPDTEKQQALLMKDAEGLQTRRCLGQEIMGKGRQ